MEISISQIPTYPKVLVLLATYNGKHWLEEQIDSILRQRGVNVSVVIGDDCSDDGTQDLVTRLYGKDARVQFRRWDSPSGSAGANFRRIFRQMPASGFDFVALSDQDDLWLPDKLISAVHAIRRTGSSGYSCAVRSFWPDGRERTLRQTPATRGADFLFEGAGQGCTIVMTQPLFSRVREFCIEHSLESEALHYHDWLIYLLARSWRLGWYFDPQPHLRYRQHVGNEIGSRGSVGAVLRRLEKIRNGWYKTQIAAALRICQVIQGEGDEIRKLAVLFLDTKFPLRRFRLIVFFLRHGRRRLVDRAVMAAAVVAGWL